MQILGPNGSVTGGVEVFPLQISELTGDGFEGNLFPLICLS